MRKPSSRPLAFVPLALVVAACTNGGKNQRDTTGMTPSSAADSITSRRDTLGGRMRGMMPRTARDSMHRMTGDTTRRRP